MIGRWARLCALLTLLLVALFGAAIGLIRAQPFTDTGLADLLRPPDGCPAPCFLGIRPGGMDIYEALLILRNHHWVALVDDSNYNRMAGAGTIYWTWRDDAPPSLRTIRDSRLMVFREVVTSIHLDTTIPFGYIPLRFGDTPWGGAGLDSANTQRDRAIDYWVNYRDLYLQVQTYVPCPARTQAYLHSPARLSITVNLGSFDTVPPSHLARFCDP